MLKFEQFINEKKFSEEKRETLAEKGFALPDGSFPIESVQDFRSVETDNTDLILNGSQYILIGQRHHLHLLS